MSDTVAPESSTPDSVPIRITCAQLNPIVGDIAHNLRLITDVMAQFWEKSDLIVFSELVLTGYPPQDLLDYDGFILSVQDGINLICAESKRYPHCGFVIGAPVLTENRLANRALFIHNGAIIGSQDKLLLPYYDVFDEPRYFVAGTTQSLISFKGHQIGLSICEDAWSPPYVTDRGYTQAPLSELAQMGATLIINISASPFEVGKQAFRTKLFQTHARDLGVPIVFVNQVGANDELVFDGHSFVMDSNGACIAYLQGFKPDVVTTSLTPSLRSSTIALNSSTYSSKRDHTPSAIFHNTQDGVPPFLSRYASIAEALKLGLSDYCAKTGFSQVVLGLSGGIDSAVVAVLAAQALGPDAVLAVALPSEFSSDASLEDATQLAQHLGISLLTIPIHDMVSAFKQSVKSCIPTDDAEHLSHSSRVVFENTQARIRGQILMGISNDQHRLLLTTGNKSELSVGYCTLYGDMCGGLNILADLYKQDVYGLAAFINESAASGVSGTPAIYPGFLEHSELIPTRILTKPPSAELRANQTDQDTLPDYAVLDPILTLYNEAQYTMQDIISLGHDPELVTWVIRKVQHNEYKRSQAAIGIRVSQKAFGKGRRMPIAARITEPNGLS